jgi:hypothetical protein
MWNMKTYSQLNERFHFQKVTHNEELCRKTASEQGAAPDCFQPCIFTRRWERIPVTRSRT